MEARKGNSTGRDFESGVRWVGVATASVWGRRGKFFGDVHAKY